jgi:uncharacterized membrane protein
MNPTLALFLRLTAIVTIGIVLLVVALFLLKILVVAAIIAAAAVGCFFLYKLFRRSRYPVIR